MNIGIIGCGLIGNKRAISVDKNDNILVVCDSDIEKAKKLSNQLNCSFSKNYEEVLEFKGIDLVIISTPNYLIKEIALKALNNDLHVLSEKPLGKNFSESKEIFECAEKNKKIIYTGFNHRFHPSIIKAYKIISQNMIGSIVHIHGHYGHGGRPGMEKEWRSLSEFSGGGELLDQGVHLIDLAIMFNGLPKSVYGTVSNLVWNIEVEDSSSFILKYKNDKNAIFTVGWVYWKNKFEFSIYGELGFIQIKGLGGSYGPEKLVFGRRNLKGGKPKLEKFNYYSKDTSWRKEWKYFKKLIKNKQNSINGLRANLIVDAIYKSSRNKKEILIEE